MREPHQPPPIYWAIASANTLLHRTTISDALSALAPSEQAHLATLRHPLRRRDWLLGRFLAKQLLQETILGCRVCAIDISVTYEPSGAPTVRIHESPTAISLSISHCDGWAFCALTGDPSAHEPHLHLGADIERIRDNENEHRTFIDLLTANERAQLAHHDDPPALATAIWCAKEAASKALRIGLGLNPDRFICRLEPAQTNAADAWAPLTVTVGDHSLPGWYRTLPLQTNARYAAALVTHSATSRRLAAKMSGIQPIQRPLDVEELDDASRSGGFGNPLVGAAGCAPLVGRPTRAANLAATPAPIDQWPPPGNPEDPNVSIRVSHTFHTPKMTQPTR